MHNINFVDRLKKYFGFLESEYGFRMTHESMSDVRPQTDGFVKYESDTMLILIDSETGYVSIRFARSLDGEKYYLTPIDIHEYLNTTEKEKELLLSTEPNDRTSAEKLFEEKFLLYQPNWKGSQGTVQDVDRELRSFSDWLKRHADVCLKGDFSQWAKLYEYKIQRIRADDLRRGKDELAYERVKDADGNWKLIKQSIFKDKLDHVEKLKKEFQQRP